MSRYRHRTLSFRPCLEGLEHRLTPSATNLWDGAVDVPPDDAYAEAAESLAVNDSSLGIESELLPVIASGEASGQEPLDLGVAEPAEIDTQAMDRNVEEVFAAQDTEPMGEEPRADEYADLVFAASYHPETLGGEPVRTRAWLLSGGKGAVGEFPRPPLLGGGPFSRECTLAHAAGRRAGRGAAWTWFEAADGFFVRAGWRTSAGKDVGR